MIRIPAGFVVHTIEAYKDGIFLDDPFPAVELVQSS